MKNLIHISLGITMLIIFLNFKTINHSKTHLNSIIITGIVSDEIGTLAGATVIVKGTKKGTTTDFDGKYAIEANETDQLEFSFTGKKKKTIIVGQQKVINVILDESFMGNEVVITSIGYNNNYKASTTSSSTTVSSNTIENKHNSSVLKSLQGTSPGLTLISSSGSPNTAKFDGFIRGTSSINGSANPLIVVDGIPSTSNQFRKLKQSDIESITTLRNNDGISIYGNKGANGVIVINTKKGLTKKEKKKLDKKIQKLNQVTSTIEPENEDYESFVENQFTSPNIEPLSTFSIDVDNASYTNIRRFINQGQNVPKDAVRVEEMVNFFKYDYSKPTNEDPFAIHTEYNDCPWNEKHKLIKIGLQGKEIPSDNLPNSNFVFLIDVSGSMSSQNKLPLLKESMEVLINQLRENDKVAIVVYAGAAGLVLPPTSGSNKKTIINSLANLNAGGSTAGGAGIELAYKIASENFIKGGNNRIILATDGDFNVGSTSNKDMETLIEEKRKTGVFLTCLGYGMGNYKDSKMEILANKGNGNYAYIDNIQEANRFLGKEFKGSMYAIAKDVKIQIEFNPKHVQNYRLIGYENRKLRPEDFKNDTIDAGELGSGHTVTALYEIIPTGIESAFTNEIQELKYTEISKTTKEYTNELATIKLRYKKPDGEKSIEIIQIIENTNNTIKDSSEDFKFSAAVAWFGLKLRDSKLTNNIASNDIKALAIQGKSNDAEGYKAEFIRLIEAVN